VDERSEKSKGGGEDAEESGESVEWGGGSCSTHV